MIVRFKNGGELYVNVRLIAIVVAATLLCLAALALLDKRAGRPFEQSRLVTAIPDKL